MIRRGLRASYDYFAGRRPSTISTIFRSNGYEITTGYFNYYFGYQGPYIDRYVSGLIKPLKYSAQCLDIGEREVLKWRSFGVCPVVGKYSGLAHMIKVLITGEDADGARAVASWHSIVIDEVESASKSDAPQIKFFYTYRPNGHAPKGYRHSNIEMRKEYRDYFSEQAGALATILEEVVQAIEKFDPSSLVVVFGDHGAYLSRGVNEEEDPTFFYQDRHLVYTAVLASQHYCATSENMKAQSVGYLRQAERLLPFSVACRGIAHLIHCYSLVSRKRLLICCLMMNSKISLMMAKTIARLETRKLPY